jgi:DNA-binding NarL/FixJ family response regulator
MAPGAGNGAGDGAARGRVVIADDDVLLREGLASLLAGAGFEVVGQAGGANDLLELVREHKPDLAIVDIRMPPTNTTEGLDAARAIREETPETAILVLSAHVEVEQATDLIGGGQASGYLLASRFTDGDEFVETLNRIIREGPSLIRPSCRSSSRRGAYTTLSTRYHHERGRGPPAGASRAGDDAHAESSALASTHTGRRRPSCRARPPRLGRRADHDRRPPVRSRAIESTGDWAAAPLETEERLARFIELIATAIAKTAAAPIEASGKPGLWLSSSRDACWQPRQREPTARRSAQCSRTRR